MKIHMDNQENIYLHSILMQKIVQFECSSHENFAVIYECLGR